MRLLYLTLSTVFGFIGLFLGPTLLALGQVLIWEWLAHTDYEGPSI